MLSHNVCAHVYRYVPLWKQHALTRRSLVKLLHTSWTTLYVNLLRMGWIDCRRKLTIKLRTFLFYMRSVRPPALKRQPDICRHPSHFKINAQLMNDTNALLNKREGAFGRQMLPNYNKTEKRVQSVLTWTRRKTGPNCGYQQQKVLTIEFTRRISTAHRMQAPSFPWRHP